MKTNHYESVVIISASLEEDQINTALDRIEETIKSNGGEIIELDKWGRKRLAYPIRKSKSGFYVVYRFTAPRELISKLERNYRLDENIIRYLTIVLDKKALEHYEKLKEKKDLEIDAISNTEKVDTSKSKNNESTE